MSGHERPLVEVRNLRFRYAAGSEAPALTGVDLTIQPGEYVLLCGASGSGKSTLCRTFNGLVPHFHRGEFEGRVVVAGLDTRHEPVPGLFRHVGLVFQDADAQLFASSVERELAFGLESLGLPPAEIRLRVRRVAETLGLTDLSDRASRSLSGGEKQRVAIAAVLALRPRLLVLDEPFVHLDPAGAEALRALLRDIRARGTAVLVAEHRLSEALADADRIVVMAAGRIVRDGPPREVLREDVSGFGVNVPFLARLHRTLGLPVVPLTVDEALGQMAVRPSVCCYWETPAVPPSPGASTPTRPSRSPSIIAQDVVFRSNGTPVLGGLSLAVHAGERVALVGGNGSGKTTLVKHFIGLYRPDAGRVVVLGQDTARTAIHELARHVGLVFQNPNDQFFRETVREELEVGPQALDRYDPAWLGVLIERFRLRPLLGRSPYRLSHGEKKRVAFASALAWRPRIVVLDEPTTGQDESFRVILQELLAGLETEGHTVVLVTHDLEFAERNAARWIALARGRVVADGPPDAVMADTPALAAAALRPTPHFHLHQACERLPSSA